MPRWTTTRRVRRMGGTLVTVPPLLVLTAAAWYRERHRPPEFLRLPSSAGSTVASGAASVEQQQQPPTSTHYTLEDLRGKTIIATGASSGIGKATAKLLHELGAIIITGSRSDGNLDLSDLHSIQTFATAVKTTTTTCDIFLACAAEICETTSPTENDNTASPHRCSSVDGFDKTFATNHIGLQALLLELFGDGVGGGDNNNNNNDQHLAWPARVVIVGSKLEQQGWIDPAIIQTTKGQQLNARPKHEWTAVKHYGDTKLCNQLLVTELCHRCCSSTGTDNTNSNSNSNTNTNSTTKFLTVSPGMVDTGLWRNFPLWFRALTWPVRRIALRSSEEAALGLVYVCASKEAYAAPNGSCFVDGRIVPVSETSHNVALARHLWTVVNKLIQENKKKEPNQK